MAKNRRRAPVIPTSHAIFQNVQRERSQDHATRQHLFREIERQLRRPVITYFTSFRYIASISDQDADILEEILRQCDLKRGLALIISSPGGDGLAAERIINICRGYSGTGEFWAIVPGKAKSAATLVCFGASRILMGPSAELGPVDPQLIYSSEKGTRKQFSAHNVVRSYDDLFDRAVNTGGHLEPFLQQLSHYDPREIQQFRELIDLSQDITVRTLKSGVMSRSSEATIQKKVDPFLKPHKTKSHGRPIFRKEAADCGLRVREFDTMDPQWSCIYELYIRTNQFVSSAAAKCIESATDSYFVGAGRSQ